MPSGLSPSSIDLWHQCPRRFEKEKVDKRPTESGVAAVTGTYVHRALELLLQLPPEKRTKKAAFEAVAEAWPETRDGEEFASLKLTDKEILKLRRGAVSSMMSYFLVEEPSEVDVIATEQKMSVKIDPFSLDAEFVPEAPEPKDEEEKKKADEEKDKIDYLLVDEVPLRGIIDRLDTDAFGNVVVTDYKNGKVPFGNYIEPKLRQLNYYGAMVEAAEGVLPAEGRLVFTAHAKVVSTPITRDSVDAVKQIAVDTWNSVKRSFKNDNFTPVTGPLCGWCPFVSECPEGMDYLKERLASGKLKSNAPTYNLVLSQS